MTATIEELRNNLGGPSAEYIRKQMHPVPDAKVVDRAEFIVSRCRGKVVLDIGASGTMHERISDAANKCYGIDKEDGPDVAGVDLDDYHAQLPQYSDVQLVVCGEVIEHLANPGWFLERLHAAYRCPVIITVPNAFSDGGRHCLERGNECVNAEHVAYYTWHTLTELVTRYGYEVKERLWYGGRPKFSEGLIFVVE